MNDAAIAKTIAVLHADSWRVAYRDIYPRYFLEEELDRDRVRHWRQRVPELRTAGGQIFLARVRGRAAGFLCIEVKRPGLAYVDNLHVLPQFQRLGIASALIEYGADWARQRGCERMTLYVLEQNLPARRFYRRTGWRVEAREPRHLLGGVGRVPALRLIRATQ
ncbi:MAG: GNAT family N-acetyltransferase [Betaproteobacteria bacterium]|nr:GNAT family N-acetyltransferase [Betaproteobacteria bacterium]